MKFLTEHPAEVGESYFEHMATSFSFGGRMFMGAMGCFLHGILPNMCTKTGSSMVTRLHDCMVAHRVKDCNKHKTTEALQAQAE